MELINEQVLLVIAYALPLALFGLLLTTHRGVATVVATLVALPFFYLLHYEAVRAIQGWPIDSIPDGSFQLIAHRISEPDRQSGEDGTIHLWVLEESADRPRAYALPYTRLLHMELVRAAQRQSAGRVQLGSTVTVAEPGTDAEDSNTVATTIRFTDKPGPKPGSKDD